MLKLNLERQTLFQTQQTNSIHEVIFTTFDILLPYMVTNSAAFSLGCILAGGTFGEGYSFHTNGIFPIWPTSQFHRFVQGKKNKTGSENIALQRVY